MMTANDIRQHFLNYFKDRGHTAVPSSSLIPSQDPTLLFTNAGMVQFKSLFTGEAKPTCKRAVSSQKCMRAGGKHNDLENVGRTARHHTFFEMLGNFSFGDYFKQEAIELSWHFLTALLKLEPAQLWITIFQEDEEAYSIWRNGIGLADSRIIAMGEKDNFWAMGETGPCGPCSEIIIDQGDDVGCGKPACSVGCDCDRFLELWNLVFMQFNRDASGKQSPLPKPSIDTGMGLERIAAVMQQVRSNYATDLFRPLISHIETLSHRTYGSTHRHDTSMQVIADHLRAITFLINDGVLPSNEGRGYVLRRIIRRAARHGRRLDLNNPFLFDSCKVVTRVMQEAYPELLDSQTYVATIVRAEEERFSETLDSGLKILQEEIKTLTEKKEHRLPGELAFKLYDTYGFPLDLTADIAREEGLTVDETGFNHAMQDQKQRARRAWKGSGDNVTDGIFKQLSASGRKSIFTGYEQTAATSPVLVLLKDGNEVTAATAGDTVMILTEQTPFYGESGGQVGDRGIITNEQCTVTVEATIRPFPEIILHKGVLEKGSLASGDRVHLQVDAHRRTATARNHTATHLLQAALKKVLGDHVQQAGSLVTPERFRFDFTHHGALSTDELRTLERLVNQTVRDNYPVEISTMPYQQAIQSGALALFGEKYSDTVRTVRISPVSMELCGGTHTQRTGDIGLFKIVGESSAAAGIRRIEAITGEEAVNFIEREETALGELTVLLKTIPEEIVPKTLKLLEENKKLQREIEAVKQKMVTCGRDTILSQVRELKGIKVIATRVEAGDPKTLRDIADRIKDQLHSGVIIVGGASEEKAFLVVVVTKDLTPSLHAGKIIEAVAQGIGGSGGGRPDMAQAGGKEKDKLEETLKAAYSIVEGMIA